MKKEMIEKILQANVEKVVIDFEEHCVELHLEAGNFCDMTGAIEIATEFDSEVTCIQTYSGTESDTAYSKIAGEWSAFDPLDLRGAGDYQEYITGVAFTANFGL
jgi:hypothetical protein